MSFLTQKPVTRIESTTTFEDRGEYGTLTLELNSVIAGMFVCVVIVVVRQLKAHTVGEK